MGIVYLVQPTELIGTDRYKVGCSLKDDLTRINTGYHKGTTPHLIEKVDNPFEVEKAILQCFRQHFDHVAGNEYFSGDIVVMIQCFKAVTATFTTETVVRVGGAEEVVGDGEEEAVVENELQCGKCGNIFCRKDYLKIHEKKCDGYHKRQCKICLKVFTTAQGKYKHNKNVKCSPPTNP